MSKKGWLRELNEAERALEFKTWTADRKEGDLPHRVGFVIDWAEMSRYEDAHFIALARNHMRALLELVHEAVQLVDEGQLVVSDMATGPDQDLEFRQWLDKYHEAIGDER